MENGESFEESHLSTMKSLPSNEKKVLSKIVASLNALSNKTTSVNPFSSFSWLVSEPGNVSITLLSAINNVGTRGQTLVRPYWKTFSGLYTYYLWVFSIFVGCFNLIAVKVLPNFEAIFSGAELELPPITKLAFVVAYNSGIANGLFLWLLLGLFLFRRYIGNRIWHFSPIWPWAKNIPLIGGPLSTFNYLVFLCHVLEIPNGKLERDSIVENIAAMVGINLDSFGKKPEGLANLARAKKNGCLFQELQYQARELESASTTYLSGTNQKMKIFLTLIFGFVIGLMVIGLYIPIFKLASTV